MEQNNYQGELQKSIGSQRWLTKMRLELAHYQFVKNKKKPVDVCYEVGFEYMSHFSYAFKKHFGYAPTDLF